ncbi:MAG: ligase-associated DNA damage response endonuclease PdeM [Cyclobacteriaceae bacterium]|nr:ligase-associated DNA damage response endonuclease PdeM [Cyclobacteriaceae bacterium]MDH4296247.1 ligase-associated DNA damage response endonuclease PdeM [Cyclobacteriaceae bacterium]MDH5250592.1 ligase-associated DNA damage response endonuclease PdeM [Cyclobacteriaceae bacterium]
MHVVVFSEQLELFPQKAVFWKRKGILFLADLHLGKINHFRKSGIAVPAKANDKNLEGIVELINLTAPKRVICLGDLFHSHYNPEWEVFGELVSHFSNTSFELVLGNHDIMSDQQYRRKGIAVHEALCIEPFIFTHHPRTEVDVNLYNLAGHLHPGVRMTGKARQSVTLPCFYFGKHAGLLPAFGTFTGLARIHPGKEDKVFVIVEDKIIAVHPN